ncbi:MAG: phosphoribosylamine--glycine ligase [Actinomycetaceae bacterium]|nr:phosphoribosylamine--glycine ligase [Actinomycetaceae bacterium]
MKTLILGSGGREHALALSLSQVTPADELYCAPGNPGISAVATLVPDLDPNDPDAVARWAVDHVVGFVVIGPEAPLVAGVADAVRAAGIPCFGPSAQAARLEGSKAFAKDVMAAAGVPTAACRVCGDVEAVEAACAEFGAPYVVKDDGLAAGKGVVVTNDLGEALAHARSCLEGRQGASVVVEEYLDGPEISLFCLCDGTNVVPLSPAQDFKRAYNGQTGPNTGGMGAYSPLPWAPEDLEREVTETIALPTIREMARRGIPFVGLLYCGLALTSKGLRVVEFNARFGDPETQVVLPLEGEHLPRMLYAAATGTLGEVAPHGRARGAAVTVVIANEGYPGALVEPGRPISGIEEAESIGGVHVIHAGTSFDGDTLRASGGRVLDIVAVGDTLTQARQRAYDAAERIGLVGAHMRTDIAADAAEGRGA